MLEKQIIAIFVILGLLLNVSTWFHPRYFSAVKIFILTSLPIIFLISLSTAKFYLVLWFIFLIFFTQDSFPNNVTYETYYGKEASTVYFHNFLWILSVFDIVLLSSLYILTIRKLKDRKINFKFRKFPDLAYLILYIIFFVGVANGFLRRNNVKDIFAEFQVYVYTALLYLIIIETVETKETLLSTIYYLLALLAITIPLEFTYFFVTQYTQLISVIRRPLINSIDDNYMVFPAFILLNILTTDVIKNIFLKLCALLGVILSFLVIFLNTGREIALLTSATLIIFLIIKKFRIKIYLYLISILLFFFLVSLLLLPEHVEGLIFNIKSAFRIFSKSLYAERWKDPSIGDRITEFINVYYTLHKKKTFLLGMGLGGKWLEFVFQPGRGTLSAYSDKTLIEHLKTHNFLSYLLVKFGFLGTFLILVIILWIFIHFVRFWSNIKDRELNSIYLGLLLIYPIFVFFSTIMQICIFLGIVMAFLRKIESFT